MDKNNVSSQISEVYKNIENIDIAELISEFFNYIFFPTNQISQLINTTIYCIGSLILFWIIIQFSYIITAYLRLIIFKRAVIKSNNNNVIKTDDVDRLLIKHRMRLLRKKVDVVRNLNDD